MKLPLWCLVCRKVALDATRAAEMHLLRNVVLLLFLGGFGRNHPK